MTNITNDWKATLGRISLFPIPAQNSSFPNAATLYRNIWGGEPDNFHNQPHAVAPSIAQGKCEGMTINCTSHPSRIDLSLMPPQGKSDKNDKMQFIADTTKMYAEFTRIIEAAGKGSIYSVIARVALYMQIHNIKSGFSEANQTVTKIIPAHYGVKLTNEEDFIFQINEPYTSGDAQKVNMNAITKWGVDRIQVTTFELPVVGTAISESFFSTPKVEEFIAASVSFDVNNRPAGQTFGSQQQQTLLRDALSTIQQKQRAIGINLEGF